MGLHLFRGLQPEKIRVAPSRPRIQSAEPPRVLASPDSLAVRFCHKGKDGSNHPAQTRSAIRQSGGRTGKTSLPDPRTLSKIRETELFVLRYLDQWSGFVSP